MVLDEIARAEAKSQAKRQITERRADKAEPRKKQSGTYRKLDNTRNGLRLVLAGNIAVAAQKRKEVVVIQVEENR